jgi:hypothetical protein
MFNTVQKNILKEFLKKEGFSFSADLSSASLHFHGFGTMEYTTSFNREKKLAFHATNSLPNGSYKCWNKLLNLLESFCTGGRFTNEDWTMLRSEAYNLLKSLPEDPTVLKNVGSQEDLTYMVWATDEKQRQHGWRITWTFSFNEKGEIKTHEERVTRDLTIPAGF